MCMTRAISHQAARLMDRTMDYVIARRGPTPTMRIFVVTEVASLLSSFKALCFSFAFPVCAAKSDA